MERIILTNMSGGRRGNFLDCLFPVRCAGCRLFCENILCAECYKILCASEPRPLVLNDCVIKSAVLFASEVATNLIHALKYEQIFTAAEACAQLVLPLLNKIQSENLSAGVHYIPVPLHPRRLRERGYNQSELIIRASGKKPEQVLERVRYTVPQAKSNKKTRELQLVDAFQIAKFLNPADTYVLIDDVVTTGATLVACINEIRTAGAVRICAVTVAAA